MTIKRYLSHFNKRVIFGAVISLPILFYLLSSNNIKMVDIYTAWEGANKPLLLAVIIFSMAFNIFVGADKLWRLGMNMGWSSVTYIEVLKICLGTRPLRIIIPFKSTGDMLNILFLWRLHHLSVSSVSVTVLFDKALNGIGIFFWLIFGNFFLSSFEFSDVTIFFFCTEYFFNATICFFAICSLGYTGLILMLYIL